MLIRAYGQFWNPDIIDWGSRSRSNRGSIFSPSIEREQCQGNSFLFGESSDKTCL